MKKFLILGLALPLVSMSAAVFAADAPAEPTAFKMEANVTDVTATVKEIDHKARTVVLEGPQGNLIATTVDDDVENFDKVKKGDKVEIQFYDSMALSVKKNDPKQDVMKTTTTKVINAVTKHKKPIKVETQEITQVADITGINAKTGVVTLIGVKGEPVNIKVSDPKKLEGISKGDQVEITYTNSVAFEVTKK